MTFNSIPNIDISNNKFYVGGKEIIIPTGSYEISDIAKYIKGELTLLNIDFSLVANNSTLRSEIICSEQIDFQRAGTVGDLLGFDRKILKANQKHTSTKPVEILKVNSLRVECNITTGAYINGQKAHTIYQFFPAVPPGFKIIQVPSNVIYLPVNGKTISHLRLSIVDQDGDLVNFRGEVITIRLHLRMVK